MGSHFCCDARAAVGVRCLAQGQLSRGVEGGERAGYSLPPPTIPAGPETRVRLSNRGGVKATTSP